MLALRGMSSSSTPARVAILARRIGLAACLLVCDGCRSDGTKTWPGPFIAAAAEREATCAIEPGGAISCWGTSPLSRLASPPGGSFRDVAIETSCGIGLRTDATLVGWGARCEPPPAGNYVTVALGFEGCAIRTSGDLVCWTLSASEYQPPSGAPVALPIAPPRTTPGPFAALSLGAHHGCAIRSDGSLHCWGHCAYRGTGSVDCPARVPPPIGMYSKVASGDDFSCALGVGGSLTCWGDLSGLPVLPPASTRGLRAISAARESICAVDSSREILCWGRPVSWYHKVYRPPTGPFIDVFAGGHHVCGLRPSGVLECWGVDQQGQVTGRPPLLRN